MIDIYSDTWRAVEAFIKEQREQAIKSLIADTQSERQRGAIEVLELLESLVDKDEVEQPIAEERYI